MTALPPPAQPRPEDRRQIPRRNPPAGKPLAEPHKVARPQPRLQLRQRPQRQAQHPLLAVDDSRNLSALRIGHSRLLDCAVGDPLPCKRGGGPCEAWWRGDPGVEAVSRHRASCRPLHRPTDGPPPPRCSRERIADWTSALYAAAERQLPRALERDLERHLARMVRRKLQRRDLERPRDRPEIRQDQLPVPDRPGKEQLADLRVRRLVLEDPRARHRRPLDPAARQQLAPPPRALRIGDIDRRRIEARAPASAAPPPSESCPTPSGRASKAYPCRSGLPCLSFESSESSSPSPLEGEGRAPSAARVRGASASARGLGSAPRKPQRHRRPRQPGRPVDRRIRPLVPPQRHHQLAVERRRHRHRHHALGNLQRRLAGSPPPPTHAPAPVLMPRRQVAIPRQHIVPRDRHIRRRSPLRRRVEHARPRSAPSARPPAAPPPARPAASRSDGSSRHHASRRSGSARNCRRPLMSSALSTSSCRPR